MGRNPTAIDPEATMDLSTFIRIAFFGFMLVAFLVMFGLPAWQKYRDEATTLEHSTISSKNGNTMPAITVCPFRNHPNRTAWKNGSLVSKSSIRGSIMERECNYSSIENITKCLKKKLYHRKEEFSLNGKVGNDNG